MPDNKALKGLGTKELEQKGRESLENAIADKKDELAKMEQGNQQQSNEQEQNLENQQQSSQQQQQQSASQQSEQTQQQQQQSNQQSNTDQDAGGDNELAQYDNVLINTYGFEPDEITDKDRKLAKSWTELQSKTTKAAQEKKQYQQQLQQVNGLIEKDPTLWEHMQAVANGQSYENPNQQDSRTEQPQQQTGQLDSESVDEKTLIQKGYLKQDDLEGLDDLARERKVMKAELRYDKDQMRKQFRNELQQERQDLSKQEEANKIEKVNKKRLDESFDRFITQTGYNLAELDDQTFEEIQQSAIWDREGSDPRMVKEDAFETAARRVLSRKGLLNEQQQQNQTAKKQQMQDTGKTVNQQSTKQNRQKSIGEELRDRAQKRFGQTNDPKAQFFKNN